MPNSFDLIYCYGIEMGRLNILIQIDNIEGCSSTVIHDFFETESDLTYLNNATNNKIKRYKHCLNGKLNVFWVQNPSYDVNINTAVLVVDPNAEGEASFSDKIGKFLKLTNHDIKIPVAILCLSSDTEKYQDITTKLNKIEFLQHSTRFVHFLFAVDTQESYKKAFEQIISIGILISDKFDLKSCLEESSEFVLETVLKQGYQTNPRIEREKNIAHLLAKMNAAWAVNKLCHDLPVSNIFELLDKQETLTKRTPLMIAALYSKKAVLAAFMNFYSSNIDMNEIHQKHCPNWRDMKKQCSGKCNMCIIKILLHKVDANKRNLTYYIVNADEKCLGAYGTILQFEQDYHIREQKELLPDTKNKTLEKEKEIRQEKQDRHYLNLQKCLQVNLGTSMQTNQVLNLMESTRQPRKWSIVVKIMISLLAVYLFQLGLYLVDVVTDSLVAIYYHHQWSVHNSSNDVCYPMSNKNNNTNITFDLRDYPKCLTNQSKFTYTMAFILLPSIFYLIEIWRNYKILLNIEDTEYLKERKRKFCVIGLICIIFFPILAVLWPGILFVWKTYPLIMSESKDHPQKRRKHKEDFEKVSLMVVVVHLLEVCVESSFSGILQWYTVLPQLLFYFYGFLEKQEETDFSVTLSSVSFTFSVFSLAWSFTSFSAEQKNGALDISWNLVSRMMLFLSNLLLIFARMNSLVLFMYYHGPGQFYPGMLWLFGHVLLMMFIHGFTLRYFVVYKENRSLVTQNSNANKCQETFMYYLNGFYVCLLNGLANIFICNSINISIKNYNFLGMKKRKTFYRQLFGDLIFLIQNAIMVGLGLTVDIKPFNNSRTAKYISSSILTCHMVGLVLKILYYKYFHIWKDMTVSITRTGLKRGTEKAHHVTWKSLATADVKRMRLRDQNSEAHCFQVTDLSVEGLWNKAIE